MQYLLLIYGNEKMEGEWTPERREADYARYGAFTQKVKQMGVHLGGEALQPVSTATCVRVRNGKVLTTDGPFAETKEQLGGYYLLECKDLDQALQLAAEIPAADYGTVEVRPLLKFDM
jgi:hypothetical protein